MKPAPPVIRHLAIGCFLQGERRGPRGLLLHLNVRHSQIMQQAVDHLGFARVEIPLRLLFEDGKQIDEMLRNRGFLAGLPIGPAIIPSAAIDCVARI